MLTAKDLEKYHQAAERILNAMDNSPVPISWHEMDRMALQSVIAKELILIDKEANLIYSKGINVDSQTLEDLDGQIGKAVKGGENDEVVAVMKAVRKVLLDIQKG